MEHNTVKKYFTMYDMINELKIDLSKSFTFICQAPRNIGKSTGTWDWIIKEIWEKYNNTKKIAYCRTNLEKGKYWRNSFNAKYYLQDKKYYMSENMIYAVKFDESGKEIKTERKEIGSVVSITNEQNFKSGIFKDYMCFFWDEFNDNVVANLFERFISLLKTIKRFSEPFYVLLMGNKIDTGNDILQTMEFDLQNPETDMIEIREDDNVFFYNIGEEKYKSLNNANDMVNQLAKYNENTDAYLNKGGFIYDYNQNVALYKKHILPTKQHIYNISFEENVWEYGYFGDELDKVYFHKVRVPDRTKTTIALDTKGLLNVQDSIALWEQDDYEELANFWKEKIKTNKLFFTTYSSKMFLEIFITRLCNMFE